jgi:hypothetical protein
VSSNEVDVTALYEIYIRPREYRQVSGMVLIKLLNSRRVSATAMVVKLGPG